MRTWFDLIEVINGSREFEMSTKILEEVIERGNRLNDENRKVYIVKYTIDDKFKLTREIIDEWNNYTSYEYEIAVPQDSEKKSKKKSHKNGRDMKKEYHF